MLFSPLFQRLITQQDRQPLGRYTPWHASFALLVSKSVDCFLPVDCSSLSFADVVFLFVQEHQQKPDFRHRAQCLSQCFTARKSVSRLFNFIKTTFICMVGGVDSKTKLGNLFPVTSRTI